MTKVKAIKYIIMNMLLTVALALACAAQEEKMSKDLERGIGQYKHENYDEALVSLKKVGEEEPQSTLASYYLGLTYKQLQQYKEAVAHLCAAVTNTPKIKGALIELIDCLYQIGKLEEAKEWIAEAEREGIRPAQTAFLKGLVLLKDEDTENAIISFENAKELDRSMSQSCNYQIGIAHLKKKDFGGAKRKFEELILIDPNSTMANFANEYINSLSKREEVMRPLKFQFGAAWQYDDNVVLQPSDTSIAANISDKGDSREVYTANVEYDKRFGDRFGVKGQYFLYYSKQNDLGFYDTLSNTLALQPSVYFKSGLLTFPTGFNYTFVNDTAYLSSPSISAVYNFMVGSSNMGQAHLIYQYKYYIWTPSTPDEDRTGNNLGGGFGWYFFYAKNKGFLNLRYALNKEWTEGNNWEYAGNRVSASVLIPVVDKLNVTLTGDAYLENFSNSNSIFHVHRKDGIYTLSALAAYKFYKDSEIQLQYTYIKDSSNISIYDYNRGIYSAGVNIKF